MQFTDRKEAAEKLASKIEGLEFSPDLLLGVARGGVVTAERMAETLEVPWHLLNIKKIGHPISSETAVGAVAPDGKISGDGNLEGTERAKEAIDELERREEIYASVSSDTLSNKTVVMADDGIATGLTMRAAAEFATRNGAEEVIIAVPVASPERAKVLRRNYQVITLSEPPGFMAVGQFYSQFPQVDDDIILELIDTSKYFFNQEE